MAPFLGGWIHSPGEVARHLATLAKPTFGVAAPHLSGAGYGKTTLLYKAFKDANNGAYIAYVRQRIGDCVSHGFGHGVDLLECVQIAIGRKAEAFQQTATEAIYGMARIDVGKGQMGTEDGAVGAWAAKAVSEIGTVSRDVLGPYDGDRAASWGYYGVPAAVKAQAIDHQVETVTLVSTYEELEDALANGYPVPVCSNQGFTLTRDAEGFCAPSGVWGHCMLIVGTRTDRPGACIMQSWGPNMPTGPLALDQPDNTFWVDREVIVQMLAMQDSWALSHFDGYPGQALPAAWGYADFA